MNLGTYVFSVLWLAGAGGTFVAVLLRRIAADAATPKTLCTDALCCACLWPAVLAVIKSEDA
jgi:hypothetical protein